MKSVAFKMPLKTPSADQWVQSREAAPTTDREAPPAVAPIEEPAEAMKRFTIDVTEGLHKRIKAQCALRGQKMADVIRELLEREFPKS